MRGSAKGSRDVTASSCCYKHRRACVATALGAKRGLVSWHAWLRGDAAFTGQGEVFPMGAEAKPAVCVRGLRGKTKTQGQTLLSSVGGAEGSWLGLIAARYLLGLAFRKKIKLLAGKSRVCVCSKPGLLLKGTLLSPVFLCWALCSCCLAAVSTGAPHHVAEEEPGIVEGVFRHQCDQHLAAVLLGLASWPVFRAE